MKNASPILLLNDFFEYKPYRAKQRPLTAKTGAPSASSEEQPPQKKNWAVGSRPLGGRLQTSRDYSCPHCTHIGSSTSNTMLLAPIHSWSPEVSSASEECQLLDASTSFFLQRKTSYE